MDSPRPKSVLHAAFPLRNGLMWLALWLWLIHESGGRPVPEDADLRFSFWIIGCSAALLLTMFVLGFVVRDHDRSLLVGGVFALILGGLGGYCSSSDRYAKLGAVFWAGLFVYSFYIQLHRAGINPALEALAESARARERTAD